jgi:hypothetical protein
MEIRAYLNRLWAYIPKEAGLLQESCVAVLTVARKSICLPGV